MANRLEIGKYLISLEKVVGTRYIALISAEGNHIMGQIPSTKDAYASMAGILAMSAESCIKKAPADAIVNYKDGSTLYVRWLASHNLLAVFFDKDKSEADVKIGIEKLESKDISGRLNELLCL